MQVAIPHSLAREEVRRRLSGGGDSIARAIPGGISKVTTDWIDQDTLSLSIDAMGQAINGRVLIEDNQVLFDVDLPLALSFVKPIVESTIQQAGQKLLAPPAA